MCCALFTIFSVAVIAFRGTNAWFDEKRTWNDWLANFIVALTPCNFIPQCGKCHKGFLQVYLALREQIKITAKTFLDAKYKLVITGHSQGNTFCYQKCSRI